MDGIDKHRRFRSGVLPHVCTSLTLPSVQQVAQLPDRTGSLVTAWWSSGGDKRKEIQVERAQMADALDIYIIQVAAEVP
ncbi:hypothetical protein E2C01_077382 [Portunus trituberculatus]|uniref:Uncharacterized protein n=1 Tax=Portunus trituberculatus TaxID=210409 RepID=A0A5B7IBB1_PORTR|nr:hypothetical protein [Portunus trituberculatus]